MADLFSMKGGTMWAVLTKIAGRMKPELGEVLNKQGDSHELIDVMIRALEAHLRPQPLVHERFRQVERMVMRTRELNLERDWGFTDEELLLVMADVPEWPAPEFTTLVLVPYLNPDKERCPDLNGGQRTFYELTRVLIQEDKLEIVNMMTMSLKDINVAQHPGRVLRWEAINLANFRNCTPKMVAGGEPRGPSAGILAAAIHHPEWFASMDGGDTPFVWLPGYRNGTHQDIMNIRRHGSRRAQLHIGSANFHDEETAVPTFVTTTRPQRNPSM